MFYDNFDSTIFSAMLIFLGLILFSTFFVSYSACQSGDKLIKKKEKSSNSESLIQVKHTKFLFLFFYKRNEGICKNVFFTMMRNYVYCMLAILSIVFYAIFKTKFCFIFSLLLVFGELFFIPIDIFIHKKKTTKQR
jgi:hypothetical protein